MIEWRNELDVVVEDASSSTSNLWKNLWVFLLFARLDLKMSYHKLDQNLKKSYVNLELSYDQYLKRFRNKISEYLSIFHYYMFHFEHFSL